MGHFDRPRRIRQLPALPERLQLLDQELMRDRTRDFDYLYAVGSGLRIQVCVMRDEDNHFFATASLGSKAFRVPGGSPSGAYLQLVMVLKRQFASASQAERDQLVLEQQGVWAS